MVTLKFPCTKEKFAQLVQVVEDSPKQFKDITLDPAVDPTNPFPTHVTGVLDTHDVDMDIDFTEPTLTISVVKCNSFLARHASDATISSHITELINKYLS